MMEEVRKLVETSCNENCNRKSKHVNGVCLEC